jgi:hypothetical protein
MMGQMVSKRIMQTSPLEKRAKLRKISIMIAAKSRFKAGTPQIRITGIELVYISNGRMQAEIFYRTAIKRLEKVVTREWKEVLHVGLHYM